MRISAAAVQAQWLQNSVMQAKPVFVRTVFYVHSKVHDEFVAKFDQAVQLLKVGNGLDEGVTIGPVISEKAKQNIQGLIDRAGEQGANPVSPTQALDGLFIQPVVIKDVKHSMDIVQQEIFGPVAPCDEVRHR